VNFHDPKAETVAPLPHAAEPHRQVWDMATEEAPLDTAIPTVAWSGDAGHHRLPSADFDSPLRSSVWSQMASSLGGRSLTVRVVHHVFWAAPSFDVASQ
jgi:hypothetical protein